MGQSWKKEKWQRQIICVKKKNGRQRTSIAEFKDTSKQDVDDYNIKKEENLLTVSKGSDNIKTNNKKTIKIWE